MLLCHLHFTDGKTETQRGNQLGRHTPWISSCQVGLEGQGFHLVRAIGENEEAKLL